MNIIAKAGRQEAHDSLAAGGPPREDVHVVCPWCCECSVASADG